MTERTGPEKPKYKITSAELDRYVDVRSISYDDAFRQLGLKSSDDIDFTDDPDYTEAKAPVADTDPDPLAALKGIEPGPSLSLKSRAHALGIIIGQFNQENKTRGAHESSDYNGMERRYDRLDEVIGNMRFKASRMGREAVRALNVLANGDSSVPMPPDENHASSIESRLRKEFGPGAAYASDRDRMLRRAYRSAGLKKPR